MGLSVALRGSEGGIGAGRRQCVRGDGRRTGEEGLQGSVRRTSLPPVPALLTRYSRVTVTLLTRYGNVTTFRGCETPALKGALPLNSEFLRSAPWPHFQECPRGHREGAQGVEKADVLTAWKGRKRITPLRPWSPGYPWGLPGVCPGCARGTPGVTPAPRQQHASAWDILASAWSLCDKKPLLRWQKMT